MTTNVGNPKESCPYKNVKEKEEKQDPEKHWIKFVLKDPEGNPTPDVTLMISLPDGSVLEKTSDEYGVIEIKNIEEGECKIEYDVQDVTGYSLATIK